MAEKTPVKKVVKPKAPPAHPKYSEMVAAAVGSLKERGGSSRQAILKYIKATYKVGDSAQVNAHLKMALRTGVTNGALKQSKGTGAAGSFKLGEKPKVKDVKPKAAKKITKPKVAKPKKTPTKKTTADKKPKAKTPKKEAKKTAEKNKATATKKATVKPKTKTPTKKAKTTTKSPKPKKAKATTTKVKKSAKK